MPDREPHPFVRQFAAQQQREVDVSREGKEQETITKPRPEYDLVEIGRLAAPPVQEQFREKARDQVLEPEREVEPVEANEVRAPEAPRLVLRPPFALDVEQEVPAERDQQAPGLAERRRRAEERGRGLENKALSDRFTRAKLRTLAERRFNAAAKDLDYGQER